VAKKNVLKEADRPRTHEGGLAKRISPEATLKRLINTCLLWEDTFYVDGEAIADLIRDTVAKCDPAEAAQIISDARNVFWLRHAPLWGTVAMADASPAHRAYVEALLGGIGDIGPEEVKEGSKPGVIRRPDEIGEFLSLYWLKGKRPLSHAMKRGLAKALLQFDKYQLGKWKGSDKTAITLRDALRLLHPTPKTAEQGEWFKGLIDKDLESPDTWEVQLSSGSDKAETFTRLMAEGTLGGMAFLMNLRNMIQAGVTQKAIGEYADKVKFTRVLPYRFVRAEQYAPSVSDILEKAMLGALANDEKLPGKTILLIDVSVSMRGPISTHPSAREIPLNRIEAASALAIHAREVSEEGQVWMFSDWAAPKQVPNRRGFALRDLLIKGISGGTHLFDAVDWLNTHEKYDRLIIFTDEQATGNQLQNRFIQGLRKTMPDPLKGSTGYVVNVAPYQFGVGYGAWINVSGFSTGVIRYILENERVKVAE